MSGIFPQTMNTILRGYAAILFLDSRMAGACFLAASFFYPVIGAAGLLATLCSYAASSLLRFPSGNTPIYIYNSLLTGLSLGAFFEWNNSLATLIVISALLCTLVTLALQQAFSSLNRLPVLSLPFVLTTAMASYCAMLIPGIQRMHQFEIDISVTGYPWLDAFFGTIGAIFFTPHPLAGLLILVGLTLSSRFMAILALCGYITGTIGFQLLNIPVSPELMLWTGFNFILITIALAGFYTIPGTPAMVFAFIAALIATPLILIVQVPVLQWGLPIMISPFIFITLSALLILRQRDPETPPHLAPVPGIPELSYERLRLLGIRSGDPHSTPLQAPFFGAWNVYQGFNDRHTHQSTWRHALDFYILKKDRSFNDNGQELEDYYCFGLPIVAPASGKVVRIVEHLPDNAPGRVDTYNNWGNLVLMQLDCGRYLLLAHLKQHSIKVREGDLLRPGKLIARCGNSGRSTQPHLHVHVQIGPRLGDPTHPFHLNGVIQYVEQGDDEYRLVCTPETGDIIENGSANPSLCSSLHLPPGRILNYEILNQAGELIDHLRIGSELNLHGQSSLAGTGGARAFFEEINGLIKFSERSGSADKYLDAWLLANGLTPLSDKAVHWSDQPSLRLANPGILTRILLGLWYPLGTGLQSSYTRRWDDDSGWWVQSAEHRLPGPGPATVIRTESILHPDFGFAWFSLQSADDYFQARLIESGGRADEGIPEWRFELPEMEPYSPRSDTGRVA